MPNPAWGVVKLYSKKQHRFPYGLLSKVIPILEEWTRQHPDDIFVIPNIKYDIFALGFKKSDGVREYQKEAIGRVLQNNGGIVVAATGAGKSLIGTKILQHTRAKGRQLVVVPTKDLLNQWEELKTGADVYTYQKLNKGSIDLSVYGVVIFDECHHAPAKTIYNVGMKCSNAIMVGLTATPHREDGEEMKMYAVLGDIVHTSSIQDMVEGGHLVPAKVTIIDIPKVTLTPMDDYRSIYQKAIVMNSERNDRIRHWAISECFKGQVLILIDSIAHGKDLCEVTEEILKDSKKKCIFVQGGTKDRQQVFQEILDGDYDIIFATKVYGEGVNFPALKTLIVAGGGKGTTKIVQQVGRILRTNPGKDFAQIIDFYDNTRILKAHSNARLKIYKECGFEVTK